MSVKPLIGDEVQVDLLAVCDQCKHYHNYLVSPAALLPAMEHWNSKHRIENDCRTRFHSEKRTHRKNIADRLFEKRGEAPWWLDYKHNAAVTLAYRASGAITNAIESLATSSTWLAGYESATLDNTSNKDVDIWISGKTTVGTTPTINTRIEHHAVSEIADGVWPDVFDGTTSAETVTSAGVKDGICIPIVFLNVDATTSNREYAYTKRSLAAAHGGLCPGKVVFFTTHNTGVNLNATGGNQVLTQTGVQLTVA